jgi:hypothetical protein
LVPSNELLVAGGEKDPNIAVICRGLHDGGVPFRSVLVGESSAPRLTWDLGRDELTVDGELISPRAAFLRHDVFTALETGSARAGHRAYAWYTTLAGWVSAHAPVRVLNRRALNQQLNKPWVLVEAASHGLDVPDTVVSNDARLLSQLIRGGSFIGKPVNGGEYTRHLAHLLSETESRAGAYAAPAIIQPELTAPDLRVYVIGSASHYFTIHSPALDYRTGASAIEYVSSGFEGLERPLFGLANSLQLDFAAADFKRCPVTGRFLFLEINTAPMFSSFDEKAGGALTRSIIDWLKGDALPKAQDPVADPPRRIVNTHFANQNLSAHRSVIRVDSR